MYTQNKIAESTAPCFTPFVIEKESDRPFSHLTFAVCEIHHYEKVRENRR